MRRHILGCARAIVRAMSARGGAPRRSAIVAVAAILALSGSMAQSPITTYGYSRATLPGIPGMPAKGQKDGSDGEVFPPQYYIYFLVKPGSQVAAKWAWVLGRTYDCELRRVTAPVIVDSDVTVKTGKTETLVPKTSDDVYQVVLGDVKPRTEVSQGERELTAANEAVIALALDGAPAYAAIRSIKALPPAAAM